MMVKPRRTATPFDIFRSLIENRVLVARLASREIALDSQGSLLGHAWVALQPILMLLIYWLVFTHVLNVRWPGATSGRTFLLALFVGLIVFGVFSDCITRAPRLLLEHPEYIKKLVFPIEVLPWMVMARALTRAGVALVVLLVFRVAMDGLPPATIIALPLVVVPLILFCMGLSWLLSALGVFARDLATITTLAMNAAMFLSPVFYPLDSISPQIRPLFRLNPLTDIIEMARAVILWGTWPDPAPLALLWAGSIAVAWLGLAWFVKTRHGFADVV